MAASRLWEYTKQRKDLFALPDEDFLRLIHADFQKELVHLQRAYTVERRGSAQPGAGSLGTTSPSRILYGKDYDEVNRTLVGALCMKWIFDNRYDTFVANQAESLRLSRESFAWMHNFYEESIRTPTELYALITSVVVNDVGKDDELSRRYMEKTGEDISALNHDMILLKAVRADLLTCFERLPPEDLDNIIRNIELAAEFNLAQLAQAENAPASLGSLLKMRGHSQSFKLRFMEQILDVAGAAGHLNWNGAQRLTQSNFDALKTGFEAGMDIISGGRTPRQGYDSVLERRLNLLREKGFRSLQLSKPEDRALARILCMGSVADQATADVYDQAWTTLEETARKSLAKHLNIDGSTKEPAVQVTYVPAMITQVVNTGGPVRSEKTGLVDKAIAEKKVKALQSGLRYLNKVLSAPERPEGQVTVIERNVRATVMNVVQSPQFQTDPTILEQAPIPRSQVAM
ncbi:hypothetical protein GGS23DRAFT_591364 [Durotheca rogersii]|uniref:uncharacterized protein n=1 Tax=Durotheca rogersii TaxID=419775 RepID=UPI00222119EC|nr:uncharacterized protein GGS23DRAFT_591364 [Durotheca rogersii]KAI5852055.1 hypothetical protein GGS23DRAFT_591364 [Durotheca rogersii]